MALQVKKIKITIKEIENNGSEIAVVTTKTLYVPVGKYARAMLVFGVTKELAK